jgi:hypothetical protein
VDVFKNPRQQLNFEIETAQLTDPDMKNMEITATSCVTYRELCLLSAYEGVY